MIASVLMISVFIIGYLAIAFEHPIKLNKAASALITGVLCWTIYMVQSGDVHQVTESLLHHLGDIAGILFFSIGCHDNCRIDRFTSWFRYHHRKD